MTIRILPREVGDQHGGAKLWIWGTGAGGALPCDQHLRFRILPGEVGDQHGGAKLWIWGTGAGGAFPCTPNPQFLPPAHCVLSSDFPRQVSQIVDFGHKYAKLWIWGTGAGGALHVVPFLFVVQLPDLGWNRVLSKNGSKIWWSTVLDYRKRNEFEHFT